MGQSHNTNMNSSRVIFDEKGDNGLILCDKYIPPELLVEIFCNTDLETLLNCQIVCKRWRMLISSYVWRKKAETTLGKPFPRDKKGIHWHVFYLICKKNPFERNLIKNHSGEHGVGRYWQTMSQYDQWIVENPPVGVPELPLTEPVFEGKQNCFVTSFQFCYKVQQINLMAEGFTPYIMDVLQPTIEVSEWYSCRWDCPAIYECQIRLLKEGFNSVATSPLDVFQMNDNLVGEKQNKWFRVSHIFKNYGPGVRKINFTHGGKDQSYWAGHYGSKMAGACVYIRVPPVQNTQDDEMDTPPILDE